MAITSDSVSVTSAVATPLITFFFAAVFGGLAYALHGLRTWARGPAIVMELLLIPIGWEPSAASRTIGIAMALTGLLGAGLLLAPSTRAALGLDR